MIQTDRNLKNVGKRPKCPECHSGNPISRGSYWECRKCERCWRKFLRGVFRKKLDRPDCKFCGTKSEYVVANGYKWLCTKCGRGWVKLSRPKRKDLGERPKCQSCGSPDPYSSGNRWTCVKCGKSWFKEIKVEMPSFSILELHKVPVHEI